jgi:hypothetical protein
MAKKFNVKTIPFEAKINIQIPGSFYARLQQLVVHYGNSKPHSELLAAMQALAKNEQAKSEFEYHIHTLTILIWEIENAAKEQNLLKDEEIEIPEEGAD